MHVCRMKLSTCVFVSTITSDLNCQPGCQNGEMKPHCSGAKKQDTCHVALEQYVHTSKLTAVLEKYTTQVAGTYLCINGAHVLVCHCVVETLHNIPSMT